MTDINDVDYSIDDISIDDISEENKENGEEGLECLDNPPAVIESTAIIIKEEDSAYYGKYTKKSGICPICTHTNHMRMNLMRARDHMALEDISFKVNISVDTIDKHFRNHFIISKSCKKILALKEEGSDEANDLVSSIMEGEVDLYGGARGVLDAKSQRLNIVKERIKKISDLQETEQAEDFNVQELVQLHKVAEDLENSILKTYQIIDKKLFPVSKSELSNAVLQYKLSTLSKLLDNIQAVFLEFENKPEYSNLISELRIELSKRFNIMEEAILKSGGIMNPSSGGTL